MEHLFVFGFIFLLSWAMNSVGGRDGIKRY